MIAGAPDRLKIAISRSNSRAGGNPATYRNPSNNSCSTGFRARAGCGSMCIASNAAITAR